MGKGCLKADAPALRTCHPLGASHPGLVPLHSLPGAEQASWGAGVGAGVIVAMTVGEGNALSAQGPGGTAGREDYPALAPTPLGEKAVLHRREEGRGLCGPETDPEGLRGPCLLLQGPLSWSGSWGRLADGPPTCSRAG